MAVSTVSSPLALLFHCADKIIGQKELKCFLGIFCLFHLSASTCPIITDTNVCG